MAKDDSDMGKKLFSLAVGGGKSRSACEVNVQKLSRRLDTVERITSEREEMEITEMLRRILEEIPCGGNVQELMENREDLKAFAEKEYPEVLGRLFAIFNESDNEIVRKFFLIHACGDFVVESLDVLVKGENLKANANFSAQILKDLMEDEEIFWTAFVDMSLRRVDAKEENPLQKLENQYSMEKFIQLLVSVPERLANCLQGCVPEMFRRQIWGRKLTVRVLLALYAVGKINDGEKREIFATEFLALLFSRIIVDYNFDKSSMALIESVRVLQEIADESDSLRRTINQFLGNLTRSATEIYAMIVFENFGDVRRILGDVLPDSESWKFALLTKVPLFTFTNSSNIVRNLVEFLGDVSDGGEQHFLQELVEKVLSSWSSRFSIENVSVDQHLYITKFLILGVLRITRMEKYQLKDDQILINVIKKKIYEGIPHHLRAMDPNLRAIGMITAEMIVNEIFNVDEESKMNFEVEKMEQIDKELVKQLRELADFTPINPTTVIDLAEVIRRIENGGENQVKIKEERLPERILKEEPVVSSVKVQEIIDEDDLDSDDDLIPYDMSNDVSQKVSEAPKYLLDLQDALTDPDNADRFEESLRVCVNLIQRQLPDNELQLGLDLLQLLLTLKQQAYCEDFEKNRFSGCVAICCVIPKEAAQHICKEFYTKQSNYYSVSCRIRMLEILGETAKELSKIQKLEEEQEVKEKLPDRKFTVDEPDPLKEAREVIEKRILGKTRRFATKTKNLADLGAVNRFAGVAGHFFWPLLHGFGRNQLVTEADGWQKQDTDAILLKTFINTLSVLMASAQNCPGIQRFAKELFALAAVLRFHSDSGVRLAVLQMIGSVLMTLPVEMLQRDFQEYLLELINWLMERVGNNVVKRDPDEECKKLGRHLLVYCTNVLKELK